MNNEDYVSYELALKLKACGFDEPCDYGYSVKMRLEPEVSFGEPKMVHSKDQKNYNDNRKGIEKGLSFCSAPTLWQAQKWLREKGIAVSVQANEIQGELWYSADIITTKGINELVDGGFDYMEYEAALSAGIASALELIRKGK